MKRSPAPGKKRRANHDVDALLACYAVDATLESPVDAHILAVGVSLIQVHRVYCGWRRVEILSKTSITTNNTFPLSLTVRPGAGRGVGLRLGSQGTRLRLTGSANNTKTEKRGASR